MADLGNKILHTGGAVVFSSPISYVGGTLGRNPITQPTYGEISGALVYSTTPVAYSKVSLTYEPTNKVVGVVYTDVNGLFEFSNVFIGGSTYTYRVTAYRDTQNARVYSGVQAVNPY